MKRITVILLAMLIILALGGCNNTKSVDDRNAPSEMTVIDKTNSYVIYRHDKTGVYYFCVIGSEGRSACVIGSEGRSVCVMLNPDGTPYTGE